MRDHFRDHGVHDDLDGRDVYELHDDCGDHGGHGFRDDHGAHDVRALHD